MRPGRYVFCGTFRRTIPPQKSAGAPPGRYPAHCSAEFGLSSRLATSDRPVRLPTHHYSAHAHSNRSAVVPRRPCSCAARRTPSGRPHDPATPWAQGGTDKSAGPRRSTTEQLRPDKPVHRRTSPRRSAMTPMPTAAVTNPPSFRPSRRRFVTASFPAPASVRGRLWLPRLSSPRFFSVFRSCSTLLSLCGAHRTTQRPPEMRKGNASYDRYSIATTPTMLPSTSNAIVSSLKFCCLTSGRTSLPRFRLHFLRSGMHF